MTTISIFRDSEQIDTLPIKKQFYINENPEGELYWYESIEDAPYRTGVFQIWLQSIGYNPKIFLVPPNWQLIIDDVWMEKKAYFNLENLDGLPVRC